MTNPAYEFRKRFDSSNDLAKYVASAIVDEIGASIFVQNLSLKLFNALNFRVNTSPPKLIVDCLYLSLNSIGTRIRVRDKSAMTKELFGFRIRPEPYRWIDGESEIVCKMLKCDPTDLPLRGATGEVMGSSASSGTSSQ